MNEIHIHNHNDCRCCEHVEDIAYQLGRIADALEEQEKAKVQAAIDKMKADDDVLKAATDANQSHN